MARSQRTQSLLQFSLLAGSLIFINILANQLYTHIDLTEEKRYTLTKPTREMLKGLKDRVYVRVLLEGDFPAGFKRLRTATREMLDDFRSISGYIDYQFEDPNKGSPEEVKARRRALLENEGIAPVNLNVRGEGESKSQIIYPTAIFHYGQRKVVVNLLENQSPTLSPDEVINNSISLLEYKFANAIKKLQNAQRPIILFTRGHGELDELQTKDFEHSLHQFYDTDRITLDSVVHLATDKCALLIVAQPRAAFSERDKFIIDQYIMNGGKVLWLLDRLDASLDSLRHRKRFIPSDYPLNLEDMLFKYGVRIQPDLVLDMECTQIPLQVGVVGNAPQFRLFPWPYHLAVLPTGNHPVVKNLDRVEMRFCSSIDTIRTKTPVRKTVLLRSSKYSRLQFSPIEIGFDIMGEELKPEYFNKGHQTLGVLLEGTFPSNYENRVSAQMAEGLKQLSLEFQPLSKPTAMIVISDGDVAANFVRDREKKEWLPLGFNRFENATYANRDLLINAVEYLIESSGVIEARSREVKLRLLDTVKAKEEKPLWQALNIGAPLVFLTLFGIFFHWRRKRRYAR